MRRRGFTLIELLVVLAVVGLLVSIAMPRYFDSLDRARENALRTSLGVMRNALDQYATDRGRYPDTLDDLVATRYLRAIPVDPISGRRDGWVTLTPSPAAGVAGRVGDVRSGAAGRARDGSLFADL